MIKTRFAPSPTGELHIGGVRTALFSYLFAKKNKGQFLLRIEDTDKERSSEGFSKSILEACDWLGFDCAAQVTYQSNNLARHKEVSDKLLENDDVYFCYCSKERLENLRQEQIKTGQIPKYDNHCRDKNYYKNTEMRPVKEPVIRFKNPQAGEVIFDDLVKGSIVIKNSQLDDFVIFKTDGSPTYNFAVSVDDLDAGVTHVLRGDDHINNTPKQINLLAAICKLEAKTKLDVVYGHVPMILGADGTRLSKRHNALSVLEYRQQGFLKEALLNYLARLGWSHGDQEIFSMEELIKFFSINSINNSPASFDYEKLLWVNQQHIKDYDLPKLAILVKTFLVKIPRVQDAKIKNEMLGAAIDLIRARVRTLVELAEQISYFFMDDLDYKNEAVAKHLDGKIEVINRLIEKFEAIDDWNFISFNEEDKAALEAKIEGFVTSLAHELNQKTPYVGMAFRVAITGVDKSPATNKIAVILGKQEVLKRLQISKSLIN